MRKWVFFFGIFLLGYCEAQAQAFSIFPRERKEALWDAVLVRDEAALGPRIYRFGALNGSLYERIQGGDNAHLWAMQWASDSAFLDSG